MMDDKELIDFFDNYCYMRVFNRTKKIYELTNNLDLYLLNVLKKSFTSHYLNKALKIAQNIEQDNTGDYGHTEHNASFFIKEYLKDRKSSELLLLDETLGTLITDKEYKLVESIFEDMADFLYEIDELIRYKENKSNAIEIIDIKDELYDFSETSIVGKIIFLEKLGVIEFLRTKQPFNTSVNSIATVLSAVTGAKSTSIQPLLNALLSKEIDNRNNPLNSIKTVHSIENRLSNIGFIR